jgi:hypothetical protein
VHLILYRSLGCRFTTLVLSYRYTTTNDFRIEHEVRSIDTPVNVRGSVAFRAAEDRTAPKLLGDSDVSLHLSSENCY